jgi:hypothetical protein
MGQCDSWESEINFFCRKCLYIWQMKTEEQIMEIRDLQEKLGNFVLIAKVEEKSQTTLRNGSKQSFAIVSDDSGCIQLNLQEFQVNQVEIGMTVKITGVFTQVIEGCLEVFSCNNIELLSTS